MTTLGKIKPIIVKVVACLGIVGATSLMISPHDSQDAIQTTSESEERSYTPIDEKPVKSEKLSYSMRVLKLPQTETVPEEDTLDVRYTISDKERDAKERKVASEGAYCENEIQA